MSPSIPEPAGLSARALGPAALLVALALAGAGCGDDGSVLPDAGPDLDGSAPADAGGDPDAGEVDESAFLFDETQIRTYDLEVDETDWQWLNDNARLEEYVPGTLIFEGERWENVGVRFKGGFGALGSCFNAAGERTCSKLSMKVDIHEYVPDQRFFGLNKLQFHSMNKDPSQMHDMLAYGLFRDLGVATSRSAYARLRVNGEDQGLFVLVEQIDGRFSDRAFGDEGGDGNLYKEVWPMYSEPDPYVAALATNEEVGDVSGMTRFAGDLMSATDETFFDVLGGWTDLDRMYRYLAVDRAINNWDGIFAWYCLSGQCGNHNYFWYESEDQSQVWLVPWDMDNTFTDSPWERLVGLPGWREPITSCEPISLPIIPGLGVRPAACDPLIDRLIRLGWDRFREAARALLDGPFRTELLLDKVDRYEDLIQAIVAEDAHGPGLDAFYVAVDRLKAAIPNLRATLESEIAE